MVPMENGEEDKKKDDIFTYRTREEVLDVERTVVVTYEQELYNRNLKTFINAIEKRKTILFTNNHEWRTAQIIKVYRGTAKIEDDFKRMKSPILICIAPVFHCTDQELRVHAFSCVLALMLLLLRKRKLLMAAV